MNAPQCYVIYTLLVLFYVITLCNAVVNLSS